MNRFNGTANLTRDPELRTTASGLSVCNLRAAINRRRGKNGEDRGAVYFDVTVWGAHGENCAKYLRRGSKVGIDGRLELEEFDDRDGNRRQKLYVVADDVGFLDKKPASEDAAG